MKHAPRPTYATAGTRDAAPGATAPDDEILMLLILLVERCRAGEHSWQWTGRTTPDESGAMRYVLGCEVCSARRLGDPVCSQREAAGT